MVIKLGITDLSEQTMLRGENADLERLRYHKIKSSFRSCSEDGCQRSSAELSFKIIINEINSNEASHLKEVCINFRTIKLIENAEDENGDSSRLSLI